MNAKTGVELIAAERQRQIEAEGWTPEHDDEYLHGELIRAAVCYALEPGTPIREHTPPMWWPWTWSESWWKPTPGDRIRELTKAGALIAAEIDRLQRATGAPE